jgi:hypothetical protein
VSCCIVMENLIVVVDVFCFLFLYSVRFAGYKEGKLAYEHVQKLNLDEIWAREGIEGYEKAIAKHMSNGKLRKVGYCRR